MNHHQRTWTVELLALAVGILLLGAQPALGLKTCYDCHKTAKTAFEGRKVVHQPVKDQDCESCHGRHGFANNLVLVNYTDSLCYSCHGDLETKFQSGTKHQPLIIGKCWDCHDPHASDKKGLLRSVVGATDDPSSCFGCHSEELADLLKAQIPHDPFTKLQCTVCHDPHNSEFAGLLKSEPTQLCASCHDPADKAVAKAHQGKGADGLACTDCHSGHSSNKPGLMSDKTHAPFSEGQCDVCHAPVTDKANIQYTDNKQPGELCGDCHSEQIDATTLAYPHAAVETGNCDNCHAPHSSRYDNLLRQTESKLCGECHSDLLQAGDLTPHAPVVDGNCSTCHDVHGSANEKLVKTTESKLCLECHTVFATAKDSARVQHAALEDGCLGCHGPHEGISTAVLRTPTKDACVECHKPGATEVASESVHPPYVVSDCAGCHDPHFSDREHLVKADNKQLCLSCHPEIGTRINLPAAHAPAVDECQTCHLPHTSPNKSLLTDAESKLCQGCHEKSSYNGDKSFVHTPVFKGDCSGCHNPHGSQKPKLVAGRATTIYIGNIPISKSPALGEKIADLCYNCHDDLQEKFRQGVPHTPVASGDCQVCHDVHGSDTYGLLKENPAQLCGGCHTLDQELTTKHGDYALTSANCLDCHNPHTSPEKGLLRTNLHPPYAEKGCDDCHSRGTEGEAVLAASERELCATCHDVSAKAASKRVQHAPFEAGECTACHSAHAGDDEKLLSRSGNDLCNGCHSDVHELANQLVQHKPFAEGSCLDCHGPHATDYEGLLIKPKENFCTSCHDDLKKEIASGEPHAPVRSGDCTQCHLSHAGANPNLLSKDKQALCSGCHDHTSPTVAAAHGGFDIAGTDCQSCHAAHAAKRGVKGLLLPNRHAPFVTGKCDQCHQNGSASQFATSPRELCLSCHEDFRAKLTQAVVHAPVGSEDGCSGCHGPHVGYGKALQVREGYKTCLTCHDTREFTGSFKHAVAFEDCGNCHDPHSAPNKGLLSTADVQGLCLGCHEDAKKSHFHPMGDTTIDPRTKAPVNCISCHSPHSSDFAMILVADKNRKLCVLCHDVSHN